MTDTLQDCLDDVESRLNHIEQLTTEEEALQELEDARERLTDATEGEYSGLPDGAIGPVFREALYYGPESMNHEDRVAHLTPDQMREVLHAFYDSDVFEYQAYHVAGKYGIDKMLVDWMGDVAREAESFEEFTYLVQQEWEPPEYPDVTTQDLQLSLLGDRDPRFFVQHEAKRYIVKLDDDDLDRLDEQGWLGVGHLVFCQSREAKDVAYDHEFTSPTLRPRSLRENHATRYTGVLPDDWVLLVEYDPQPERKDCGKFHPLPCGLDVDCADDSDEDSGEAPYEFLE